MSMLPELYDGEVEECDHCWDQGLDECECEPDWAAIAAEQAEARAWV